MERTTSLLFALLRAGLGSAACGSVMPESGVWSSVYRQASAQGVLALAWDGLQRLVDAGALPADRQPDRALKLRWACNVSQIEQRYFRQRSALTKLAALYGAHGIELLLLKGYGLSLLYPHPEHRPCGDIDIWLFGKQPEADALLRRTCGLSIDEDKHHHTTFVFEGIPVENHYDFFNIHAHLSNRAIERRLKSLAATPAQCEAIEVEGQTVYVPGADFDALFLLRHTAAHFAAAEIGLRHVADWAMFVRRNHGRIDWPALERIAREQNMHRFLHCLNALAIDCLGVDAALFPAFDRDEALERRVLAEILRPAFGEEVPKGGILRVLSFKLRRWWANRWKHRIVYREGLIETFLVQIRSHLMKPESLKA